jgi:hypothetical protein
LGVHSRGKKAPRAECRPRGCESPCPWILSCSTGEPHGK